MDDIVTGGAFLATINLAGRKYLIAAPSFGQAGRLAAQAGKHMRPPQVVIMEEVRDALGRLGKPELAATVDEFEAAEIHYQAVLVSKSDDAESRAEFAEARVRLMRAQGAQRSVEWLVRNDEALAELRGLDMRLGREEHLELLKLTLRGWEGEGLPAYPAVLDDATINDLLPAGDVAALGVKAMALMSPTKEIAGN